MSGPTAINNKTEESLRGQYAGFTTRAIAFAIDFAIVNIVIAAATTTVVVFLRYFNYGELFYTTSTDEPTDLAVLITGATTLVTTLVMYYGYVVLFWVISGQTLGKRLMGLRVAQMDGSRMTFWRGTVRLIGYWISAIPFLLGFLWVLVDNQRRGWHDRMAGTCVIYSWDASYGPRIRAYSAKEAARSSQAQRDVKDGYAKS